ncbi:MAG TPA: hypothetical protein VIG80_12065 [Bacillaceae bacterium]
MELILINVFSAIIVGITIFSIIKVLRLAYKRGELNGRKFRLYTLLSAGTGILAIYVLSIVYSKLMNALQVL